LLWYRNMPALAAPGLMYGPTGLVVVTHVLVG